MEGERGGAFALSHHHANVVMVSDERAMVILSAHVAIPAVSVTSKARNDVHDHMFMHTQTHTHTGIHMLHSGVRRAHPSNKKTCRVGKEDKLCGRKRTACNDTYTRLHGVR